MYTIRATWIYSYFLAKEKLIKTCHNGLHENTVCSWLQLTQVHFIYLTRVLHLWALITQSSTFS